MMSIIEIVPVTAINGTCVLTEEPLRVTDESKVSITDVTLTQNTGEIHTEKATVSNENEFENVIETSTESEEPEVEVKEASEEAVAEISETAELKTV